MSLLHLSARAPHVRSIVSIGSKIPTIAAEWRARRPACTKATRAAIAYVTCIKGNRTLGASAAALPASRQNYDPVRFALPRGRDCITMRRIPGIAFTCLELLRGPQWSARLHTCTRSPGHDDGGGGGDSGGGGGGGGWKDAQRTAQGRGRERGWGARAWPKCVYVCLRGALRAAQAGIMRHWVIWRTIQLKRAACRACGHNGASVSVR